MAGKQEAAKTESSTPDSTTQIPDSETTRPRGVPREIPIDQIHIPGVNIRTEFGGPRDEELADSIRENGVLERLLVRDNSKWKAKGDERLDYDLMAGERRLRAAVTAGLDSVPCEVFDVDDEKAYEIMLIENLQSKDLHELDYANGLQIMMKRYGYSVEQTAQRIQKGETFVREMLSFADLPANALHAFRNGAITKSHAVLIATIPGEKQREEYAKRVLTGKAAGDYRASGEPLSVRKAKDLKEREFMKNLKGAPFPLDQQLDPSWPHSCLQCPHYNGNTPEMRQGKRPNICLNPPHYQVMAQLHAESEVRKAAESGKTVLSKTETAQVFEKIHDGSYRHKYYGEDKYVSPTDRFTDYATQAWKRIEWREVAKKSGLEPVIAVTPDGKTHRLLLKSAAEAAAKKLGHKLTYTSSTSSRRKSKPSASEQTKKAAAKHRAVAVNALLQKLVAFDWRKANRTAWRSECPRRRKRRKSSGLKESSFPSIR